MDSPYRRTFVERCNELSQLLSLYEGIPECEGPLTFVVGEPGIGRTAITEHIGRHVAVVTKCYSARPRSCMIAAP